MAGAAEAVYLFLVMSLGAVLSLGAGAAGRLLYPCEWMGHVAVLSFAAETAGTMAAAILLRRDCMPENEGGDVVRALFRGERRVWMIWLGMLANALLLNFSVGAAESVGAYVCVVINLLTGLILVAPLLSFALCWPSSAQPHGFRNELMRDEFPMIHGVLRNAAQSAGHRRRMKLFLGEGTACAFIGAGYDGIILSPLFLTALTRQELSQVFLHELAHLASPEVRREIRWRRLIARQLDTSAIMQNPFQQIAMLPLLWAEVRFGERLEPYMKKTEPLREREADACPVTTEEARCAAAAIAKAEFVERFMEENKELPCDMFALRAAYEKMLAECGEAWLEELERQEASGNDPHPSFRERREILGATHFDPHEREADAAWLREMDAVCAKADKDRKRR